MAYVTIPKDLSKVQSKVLFGLTKRQVICFGAAALIENKFIRPKTRIYQTNNLYSALVRQYELEQEVRAIAGKNGKIRKTGRGKAQADPRRA